MLKLGGPAIGIYNADHTERRRVFKVITGAMAPCPPAKAAYLARRLPLPVGFGAYLVPETIASEAGTTSASAMTVILPRDYDYLAEGDVVAVSALNRSIRVLYRRNSRHNTFLVTERCDNFCLMCS